MILQNIYQKCVSFIILSLFFPTILAKVMFDFKSGLTFTILLVVDLHAYFKRELVYIVYIMKLFSVLHDCMKHVSKLNNFN